MSVEEQINAAIIIVFAMLLLTPIVTVAFEFFESGGEFDEE